MQQSQLRAYYEQFLEDGYSVVSFKEFEPNRQGQIVLRHDIDYDVGFALQCAELEHLLGIKATYFFLMRSGFYNPFGSFEQVAIERIKDLGHQISLHFDPSVYEDSQIEQGIKVESALFKHLYKEQVKIVSFHRPADRFLNWNRNISGIEHTYLPKYFREMAYYSDSMGLWRYGNPFESDAYRNRSNIQVLIHPVWWFQPGSTNVEVVRNLFDKQVKKLRENWKNNSKIFEQLENGE